ESAGMSRPRVQTVIRSRSASAELTRPGNLADRDKISKQVPQPRQNRLVILSLFALCLRRSVQHTGKVLPPRNQQHIEDQTRWQLVYIYLPTVLKFENIPLRPAHHAKNS